MVSILKVCVAFLNFPGYSFKCLSCINKFIWIQYYVCIVSLNLNWYCIICVSRITKLTWILNILYVCIVSFNLPGYGINIHGVACMTLFRTSVLALNDRLMSLSENTPNWVHIRHTIHIVINVIKIWNKHFDFRG